MRINYDGELSRSLPISVYLDDLLLSRSLSNDKSITEVIIEPEGYDDQVVTINLSKDVFGDHENIYVNHNIDIGSFVIRPVIGELSIKVSGPLSKNQKNRMADRIKQFLLSSFNHEDQLGQELKISIAIERNDKPKYGEGYPYISYSSGSINVSKGSMKNVFKIKRYKGSDFKDGDQAFDNSINKLCEHDNLNAIFKN